MRRPVQSAASTRGILGSAPEQASSRVVKGMSRVTYVIAQPCVDVLDKACIDECPVDCIYEGGRMLYIHPDECVDCGACEPVCPVEAIYYEDDLPDKWRDYTQANVDFFDDLGSPGGASKVGKTESDPDLIANLRHQAEADNRRVVRPSARPDPPMVEQLGSGLRLPRRAHGGGAAAVAGLPAAGP